MTVGLSGLEEGDRVVLDFESHFGDARQRVVGEVTSVKGVLHAIVEADDLGPGEGTYKFGWEGDVHHGGRHYGDDAELFRLEPVDPDLDDDGP